MLTEFKIVVISGGILYPVKLHEGILEDAKNVFPK
jgi:hypothetical protein